mgnify:CR=1 FL=1
MEELEREMEAPWFWDDPAVSNQKMKEFKSLKDTVETCNKLSQQYDDIETLIEMGYEEEDESIIPEVQAEMDGFVERFEALCHNRGFGSFGHSALNELPYAVADEAAHFVEASFRQTATAKGIVHA